MRININNDSDYLICVSKETLLGFDVDVQDWGLAHSQATSYRENKETKP